MGLKRDDFSSTTISNLAKRSAFQCAICGANTVGPSTESENALISIGVAAHITAAAPGGPRYNVLLTSAERSNIANGIWLCNNDARLIDDDIKKWTESKLKKIKKRHEKRIASTIGIPNNTHFQSINIQEDYKTKSIDVREFAFVRFRDLRVPYKSTLKPMLLDCKLDEDAELGVLMCGSSPEELGKQFEQTPWTVFVKPDWLRWLLIGQSSGFKIGGPLPPSQIYGQIPAWPDTFTEFLVAISEKNITFKWQRHPDGYLKLLPE